MFDSVVSGGTVVLPTGPEPADIGVNGEHIAAIGAPGSLTAIGAGSASPVVSMTMRRNRLISPASRRSIRLRKVRARSSRTAQHRQPPGSSRTLPSTKSTR